MSILNIGCGSKIMKGVINLDKYKGIGVDVLHDLNKFPYPFKSESFDKIYAYHIIEHLNDVHKVLLELHRILKPAGTLIIVVPHFTFRGSYSYLHKTYYNYSVFDKLIIEESGDLQGLQLFHNIYTKIHFHKGLMLMNYLIEPIMNMIPVFYENSGLCYLFPAHTLEFELMKKSGVQI